MVSASFGLLDGWDVERSRMKYRFPLLSSF
jgi:hypothetical protein